MADYVWTRAYRGHKWHVMDMNQPTPDWSLPLPLCGLAIGSGRHWSEHEPLFFGEQDPARRVCMKCVDKVIREEGE